MLLMAIRLTILAFLINLLLLQTPAVAQVDHPYGILNHQAFDCEWSQVYDQEHHIWLNNPTGCEWQNPCRMGPPSGIIFPYWGAPCCNCKRVTG